ncbi:MAG TPA: heme-binding domain-containing protein [Candidatus Binataceae bacterium]|nr:heme-binding domain-containing protein [Candidatus Binataceae bacterium]
MRIVKLGALAFAVFLIVAQAFQIDKTNPPVTGDIQAPAPVKAVLRRACYPCHSNETAWPWYSNVAPLSWVVAYDVHQGRRELNFSRWDAYQPAQRLRKLKKTAEEVAEGEMPPWYYIYPMHREARLSAADRDMIRNWVAAVLSPAKAAAH